MLIVVSKGLHAPFGWANRVLYDVIPGFSLLREPFSKLGPGLVLLYGLLVALAVEDLAERRASTPATARLTDPVTRSPVVPALFGVAVLVSAFPMWTGAWVPTERPVFPSTWVEVPSYWEDAAAAINADPTNGKLLALPLNDYYQVPTSWGYYGVDQISFLVERPVAQRLPGGYYTDTPELAALLGAAEQAVLGHDRLAVAPVLDGLGASLVLVRGDLDLDMVPGRALEDPSAIARGLDVAQDVELVGRFGPLRLYRRTATTGTVDGYRRAVLTDPAGSSVAAATASLNSDVAVLSSAADAEAARQAGLPVAAVSVSANPAVGPTGIVATTGDGLGLRTAGVRVASVTGSDRLTVRDAWTVDGVTAPPIGVLGLGGRTALGVVVDTAAVPMLDDRALVQLPDGASVRPLGASSDQPTLTGPSRVGNCADTAATRIGTRRSTPIPEGVRLEASAGQACVSWSAPTARAEWVRVDLEHRTVAGANARLCLVASPGRTCLPVGALEAGSGWTSDAVVAQLPAGTTSVRIAVYADAIDPNPGEKTTISEYRRVQLTVLDPITAISIPGSPGAEAPSGAVTIPPGAVEVDGPAAGNVLAPFGPLADCNRSDARTPEQIDLATRDLADGVELSGRAHAACRAARITQLSSSSVFELQLDHEVIDGQRGARICVFDPSTTTCLPLTAVDGSVDPTPGSLPREEGRSTLRARFVVPPATTALSLYVYADGPEATKRQVLTRIRYTNLSVVPVAPFTVVVAPRNLLVGAGGSGGPPVIPASWNGPARFTAEVPGGGPVVVATHESQAPGWRFDAPGSVSVAAHGYRAAWLVPAGTGEGSAVAHGQYRPAILISWLAIASGLVALGLIGLSVGRWIRRSSRGRRTRDLARLGPEPTV